MSGFHLQEQLAAEGMGMPVVPGAASVSKTPGTASHLWKPVDEHALLDAVRRAIA